MTTKTEFVSRLAKMLECTKADAEKIAYALPYVIGDALVQDDEAILPGIGKFTVIEKAARKGRNPQTGETLEIPARRVVKFKVFAGFSGAVID